MRLLSYPHVRRSHSVPNGVMVKTSRVLVRYHGDRDDQQRIFVKYCRETHTIAVSLLRTARVRIEIVNLQMTA